MGESRPLRTVGQKAARCIDCLFASMLSVYLGCCSAAFPFPHTTTNGALAFPLADDPPPEGPLTRRFSDTHYWRICSTNG